jgi:hypothetical protein
MNSRALPTLMKYGIANDLAAKAHSAGITVTKASSLSQKDLISKFGLSRTEARILSRSVRRSPIDENTVQALLERSNFVCAVCKGAKGQSYIIHHIVEYEKTQDNSYENLIVLCPVDHDLAHQGGLTLKLRDNQLRRCKASWERQVEVANAQVAARNVVVKNDAIDYVNISRIEELCVRLFNEIPKTTHTARLKSAGILGASGSFDQKFVQNNLSGGRYLFDYITHLEAYHYQQLLEAIATKIDLFDLDETATTGYRGLKEIEGKYAFFIGGVCAKGPEFPITLSTPPVLLHYSRKRLRIEWVLDPNFLMSTSAISRIGGKNRYIVYCLVRTVEKQPDKVLVKASPLLIAQPMKFVHKVPAIAYQREFEELDDDEPCIDSEE